MDHDLERKIRDRAHQLWEAAGGHHGSDEEHWLEAERQVMAEEGMGEPGGRGGGDLGRQEAGPPGGGQPEPQPEIPADPLRNPEQISPRSDPEYPATPGPQEMPADRSPQPEMPAEPGIAEMPMPPPGAGSEVPARGGRKAAATDAAIMPAAPAAAPAAAEAKGRGGRPGKNKGSAASV